MATYKFATPSSLTRKSFADAPVRVKTKGGNYFTVFNADKKIVVQSGQNGSTYKADTIAEIKQYIGCSL
jgi:hypothetical protein